MLLRSKLNSIGSKISEALINYESVMKTLQQLLMKTKTIVNLKKALKWWKLKEVILKKLWLKKVKEKTLMKLLDKIYKMISYCLKCTKNTENTENINPKISRTSNGKTMILSNCAICDSENENLSKNKKQMDYWIV